MIFLRPVDGRRVVYSSGKRALSDGLEILAVQVTDQGNYTCRATNDGGVKESRGSIIVQGNAPAA